MALRKRAARNTKQERPTSSATRSRRTATSKAVTARTVSPKDGERATGKGDSTRTASRARGAQDWRDETLDRMRALIVEADPAILEERKWKKPSNGMTGVPVWSRDGIICTGETYKSVVKLTFARGASLPDPGRLFNASLAGGTRRAIDIDDGRLVDAVAFKALVQAAVAANSSAKEQRKSR